MPHHLIDITDAAATDLIARITAELPPGASIGRIRVVAPDGVLADDGETGAAMWGVDDDGAWRQVELDDETRELTTWVGGREIGRGIATRVL